MIDIFNRFSINEAIKLIELKLGDYNKGNTAGLSFSLTRKALEWVVGEAEYRQYGGRNVEKLFLKFIEKAISVCNPEEGTYEIDINDAQKPVCRRIT
jgi:ATP-dependent Clp protease ATP-binding subunit ClpA